MELKYKTNSGIIKKSDRGNAGIDLGPKSEIVLKPGLNCVNLGIAVEVPDSHVGILKDRSSMALLGVHVYGGVIDSSYRGDIIVLMHNSNNHDIILEENKCIVQMLVIPYIDTKLIKVDELSTTDRGNNGFGSTDKNK